MSCETALRELLLTCCPHVSPIVRPQGTPLPAVTYARLGEVRNDALMVPVPLTLARFQVDAWAASYEAVLALARDVQQAVPYTHVPPDIVAAQLDTQTQLYEDETRTYRVLMEFDIFTEEG